MMDADIENFLEVFEEFLLLYNEKKTDEV